MSATRNENPPTSLRAGDAVSTPRYCAVDVRACLGWSSREQCQHFSARLEGLDTPLWLG